MPSQNEDFPWMSHYGHYRFFENAILSHNKVINLETVGESLYDVCLVDGRVLRVFICECYAFGTAEYYETIQNVGKVDAIIINSNWCSYTTEAKKLCTSLKVGLFRIAEFMGAVNIKAFWKYSTEKE